MAARAFVKILWQLASRSRVRQGPNRATLEAGTWTICDPGREYTIELDRGARILMMLVPRAQCPGWLSSLNVLSARALPAGGPAHIAMAALAAMLRNVAHLDAESENTLHESVVALIERALTVEMGLRGLGAQPERPIRLPQVHDYILGHLADTRLNVGRVANVFGVSRRSLYNIFAPSGVTPHAFIQGAKLNRACDLLNHPDLAPHLGRRHRTSVRLRGPRAFQSRVPRAAWRGANGLAWTGPLMGGIPRLARWCKAAAQIGKSAYSRFDILTAQTLWIQVQRTRALGGIVAQVAWGRHATATHLRRRHPWREPRLPTPNS